MYPMSKDEMNYERLIKILSLYRLTLGQARQEELLEYLFNARENSCDVMLRIDDSFNNEAYSSLFMQHSKYLFPVKRFSTTMKNRIHILKFSNRMCVIAKQKLLFGY